MLFPSEDFFILRKKVEIQLYLFRWKENNLTETLPIHREGC